MKFDPRSMIFVVVIVLLAVVSYSVLNTPEHRSPGEKIGDAVDALKDRTPAEKIKDDLKK